MGQKVSDFVHDFGRIIGELEPIMPLVSHVAATTLGYFICFYYKVNPLLH